MTLTEARKIVGSIGLTIGEAKKITGGLSFPSKLPGTSYGLSARDCKAGAELAKIPGSICSTCYALRDTMSWAKVQIAYARRLAAIADPRWSDAMIVLLTHLHAKPSIRIDLGEVGVRLQKATGRREARWRMNPMGFHRWHDSGDLQSVAHLEKIIEVCRRTPQIRHWLPTRELAMLRACRLAIPENLTIRVSATMIDGQPPAGWPGSTVHRNQPSAAAHRCPAPEQDHQCGACRACCTSRRPRCNRAPPAVRSARTPRAATPA